MGKPHKHAEIIKAWADGAEIQVKPMCWATWADTPCPSWESGLEYRIKPKTIKYRTYLWKDHLNRSVVFTCTYEQNQINDYEYTKNFVKWLGDWQEVVVE